MELAAPLRSLLLSNHQPLGVALGTPRAKLTRPDWFKPMSTEQWSFATGNFEGAEVVWTLDRGMLSEARAVFSPRNSAGSQLFDSLIEMFSAEFGKAKLMKRSEERTWALKTTIPSTLSVSRRSGGSTGLVIVVQLGLAKGQKLIPPKVVEVD